MSKFFTGAAIIAALTVGLAASPSFAGGFVAVGDGGASCGSITVIGDNNTVNCTADTSDDEGSFFPGSQPPMPFPQPAPACVTPQGNFPMQQPLPFHVPCWVRLGYGGVQGWTGTFRDNFFYAPY